MLRYYVLIVLAAAVGASLLPESHRGAEAGRAASHAVIEVGAKPSLDQLETSGTGDGLTLHREPDGHFYADAEINGSSIRMLVDTGASGIALSRDDARRAGVGISIGMPNVVGRGAGGDVRGEYVTLNRVSLGPESAEQVPAVVLDGGGQSLLGQSFLGKFASVEIHGDTMVLR